MGSEFSSLVNTNKYWTKCVLALNVHGKKALLRVFHNDIGGNYAGLPKDPGQLYNFFNQQKNRKILNKLKSSKTLKQDQFDLILPPNSNLCNSNSFDITLIVLLIITFVNIPVPLGGWKKVPNANDQSLAAFVVLIRNLRNLILHGSLDDFDEPYFKKIWKNIKDCLIGLQYDQTMLKDFDELLTNDKVVFDFQDGTDFVDGLFDFDELKGDIKKKFDSNFKQQDKELKKRLFSMKKDILRSALNTLNEVAEKRLEDFKLEMRLERREQMEDLRKDIEHEQDEMKDVQCKIIDDQRKMEEKIDVISQKQKEKLTVPNHTLRTNKTFRVEKITPQDVVFVVNASDVYIIFNIQCCRIGKRRVPQEIESCVHKVSNGLIWLQLRLRMEAPMEYEFTFTIMKNKDKNIESIHEKIELADDVCSHIRRKGKEHKTLVFAHNDGTVNNIHQFKISNGVETTHECQPITTGPSTAKFVRDFYERAKKYYTDHKSVRTFPPTYYLKPTSTSIFVDKLNTSLTKHGDQYSILSEYNPKTHLKLLGLDKISFESIIRNLPESFYKNCVVMVHAKKSCVCVFVVIDDISKLAENLKALNNILKTIYFASFELFCTEYLGITGTLVFPDKEMKDLGHLMHLNIPEKSETLFITKQDFQENDFEQWINNLFKTIRSDFNTIRSKDFQSNFDLFHTLCGTLMTVMAQTTQFLPRVCENDTDQVKTILLNGEQIECITNPAKHKLIKACFGSGKTVLLIEMIRSILKEKDPKNFILFLSYDPFSALDKKLTEILKSISKEEKVPDDHYLNLKAMSLTDAIADAEFPVSDVFNLSSTPKRNIGDVLLHIKNKHPEKKVHFFVDEVPCEMFTSGYSKEFFKYLNVDFKDNTVVFSLQSVEKKREIVQEGRTEKSSEIDIESTGMTLLKLTKTMRMSRTLHDLKEILEKEIESTSYSIPLEMKKKKEEEDNDKENPTNEEKLDYVESVGEDGPVSGARLTSTKESVEEERSGSAFGNDSEDEQKSSTLTYLHDPEKILKSTGDDASYEVVKTLNTSVKFVDADCGHDFPSEILPRLFYFDKNFTFNSVDAITTLSIILRQCLESRNEEGVALICNNIQEVRMTEAALMKSKTRKPVVFAPYLDIDVPLQKLKVDLVKNLENTDNVLISDYRTLRGLEVSHSIIIVDEEDIIGPNLLVEMITRTITDLDILVLPKTNKQSPQTTIQNAFQKFDKQKLIHKTIVKVTKFNEATTSVELQGNGGETEHLETLTLTDEDRKRFDGIKKLSKDNEQLQESIRKLITNVNQFQLMTNKWDGKRMESVTFNDRATLSFDDVWKILDENKFEEIFCQNPNIVNSLRGSGGLTLLMWAVLEDRFDVFVHLMEYPQDFSLVDVYGHNVLHRVGLNGTVRYLEMFGQQTIEMLINRRSKGNNTPLHVAAWNNRHDVIRWLLAKGANPELKGGDGRRPDEHRKCDGVTKKIFRSFRSS
ncbi:repetitive organellar protein-like [Clytia hemisphaerica]